MSAEAISDQLIPACPQEVVDGFNVSDGGCVRADLCLHNLFDPSDISQVSSPALALALARPGPARPAASCQLPPVSRLLRAALCIERMVNPAAALRGWHRHLAHLVRGDQPRRQRAEARAQPRAAPDPCAAAADVPHTAVRRVPLVPLVELVELVDH